MKKSKIIRLIIEYFAWILSGYLFWGQVSLRVFFAIFLFVFANNLMLRNSGRLER